MWIRTYFFPYAPIKGNKKGRCFQTSSLSTIQLRPSRKLTAKAPENRVSQEEISPTIHFQGLLLLVSGRINFSASIFVQHRIVGSHLRLCHLGICPKKMLKTGNVTLPETNITPENVWLEYFRLYLLGQTAYFQGQNGC